MEIDSDCHNFARAQLTLAVALALTAVEQALGVDGLKVLAKVIDIPEHNKGIHVRRDSWKTAIVT